MVHPLPIFIFIFTFFFFALIYVCLIIATGQKLYLKVKRFLFKWQKQGTNTGRDHSTRIYYDVADVGKAVRLITEWWNG